LGEQASCGIGGEACPWQLTSTVALVAGRKVCSPRAGRWWGSILRRHVYGEHRYPAQLVLQDVLTLHGSQFKDADLIVASPPCQAYSYRAMPWSRAKALPPPENTLFDACFRIQREACQAAGRYIPLIVENVRGAQKWVGRARWNFGSFYLWGDVPALMPMRAMAVKVGGITFNGYGKPNYKGVAFNSTAMKRLRGEMGRKGDDGGRERNHPAAFGWRQPTTSSHSTARKAASAMIAKIPLPLSTYIARTFKSQGAANRKAGEVVGTLQRPAAIRSGT
jgi:C-5 cytosine-specific DNA methylase